jgi:hypothetical protein
MDRLTHAGFLGYKKFVDDEMKRRKAVGDV